MFDEFREGVPLRSVYWKDLRPGLVFAGGLTINGYPPRELAAYPVLSPSLVRDLHERYQLAPEKRILVLGDEGGLSPEELSAALRGAQARLTPLNGLRKELRRLKARQPSPELPVWESAWVERGSLIWPLRGTVPSFLSDLSRDIGLAEVLSREVFEHFRLPPDRPIALHLAIDLSYSMEATGKDEVAWTSAELLRDRIPRLLPKAEVLAYAFSEECRRVQGPLSGRLVERGGTDFASFARAALRHRREDRPNALLVFTDGLPGRLDRALAELARLEEAGFFYTQIIFNLADDRRSYALSDEGQSLDGYFKEEAPPGAREFSPEEYREQEEGFRRDFSSLARAAGGNQLIITVDDALGVAGIEVFDRWYGGLLN